MTSGLPTRCASASSFFAQKRDRRSSLITPLIPLILANKARI
jgi:hypothetical protein